MTGSGALEGLGKGTESLIISLVRYIIAMMPIAWVLCRLLGPTGVWHAFWITEAITAGISVLVYRKAVKRPALVPGAGEEDHAGGCKVRTVVPLSGHAL